MSSDFLPFLLFCGKCGKIPTGTGSPLIEGQMQMGYLKITIFDQYFTFNQKVNRNKFV